MDVYAALFVTGDGKAFIKKENAIAHALELFNATKEEIMNAIVHKRFNSPAAMADYAAVLARAADAIPVGSGDLPILKLVQEGRDAGYFVFGEAATAVSDDDLWAINPHPEAILQGYICFSDKNEVLGEVLRPITAEPVAYESLPVHYGKDKRGKEIELEWQAQRVLHMQCIAGPNEGASVVYKPVSGGGLKLCRSIMHEIARRFAKGADTLVPTGYLTASNYNAKRFGNKVIWNPIFTYNGWVDMDFADGGAADVADEPQEEPRRGREAPREDAAPRGRSRDAEDAEVVQDAPKRGPGRPRRAEQPAETEEPRDLKTERREDRAEDAPRGRGRGEPAPRRGSRQEEDESRGRGRQEDAEEPRGRGRAPRR